LEEMRRRRKRRRRCMLNMEISKSPFLSGASFRRDLRWVYLT
jgi:hypothetical protein